MRTAAAVLLTFSTVSIALAAPATASDASVRVTLTSAVAGFDAWHRHPGGGDYAAAMGRADAEAARLTITRTKIQLAAASTANGRLGRALALQGLAKLVAGCRQWSAFEGDIIASGYDGSDPTVFPAGSPHLTAATDDVAAAKPLIAAAARYLRTSARIR